MHLFMLLGIVLWADIWSWSLLLLPVTVYSFRYNLGKYYALLHPVSIVELWMNQNDEVIIKRKNGSEQLVIVDHICIFMNNFFISISYNNVFKETVIVNNDSHAEKTLHIIMLRLKLNK